MAKQKVERIERALRHNRREKPEIRPVFRVYDEQTGRGLVCLEDGTLLDEAYYLAELRAKGERVITLDWLSTETSKSEQIF